MFDFDLKNGVSLYFDLMHGVWLPIWSARGKCVNRDVPSVANPIDKASLFKHFICKSFLERLLMGEPLAVFPLVKGFPLFGS